MKTIQHTVIQVRRVKGEYVPAEEMPDIIKQSMVAERERVSSWLEGKAHQSEIMGNSTVCALLLIYAEDIRHGKHHTPPTGLLSMNPTSTTSEEGS